MNEMNKINSIVELRDVIAEHVQARKTAEKTILIVSAGTCGQARGSLKGIESLKSAI